MICPKHSSLAAKMTIFGVVGTPQHFIPKCLDKTLAASSMSPEPFVAKVTRGKNTHALVSTQNLLFGNSQ